MKYHEYMGLSPSKIRMAVQFVASHRNLYEDADSRLAFLACELAMQEAA